MRLLLAAALSLLAIPALADSASGTVRSYDPASGLLILDDSSVWSLDGIPSPDLQQGDSITIIYSLPGDNAAPVIETVSRG